MTAEEIKKIVEIQSGYPDLSIRCRKGDFPVVRGMYIYLARKYTDNSLERIGAVINRDHSTASYWLENLLNTIQFEKDLKWLFTQLESIVRQSMGYISPEKYFDMKAQEIINEMLQTVEV